MVKIRIGGTVIQSHRKDIPHWSKLHLYDGCNEAWYMDWKKRIPSIGCGCHAHFEEILATLPPDFSSPDAFFRRGIQWHNAVNSKPNLNYPIITLDQAYTLWRHRRPQTDRTRCVVTVATGKKYRELLDVTRPSIQRYAEKNNADFIELTNETKTWWGFEKFRAKHFAEQYEETLFIDADCVIHPDAPSIFGRTESLAIHDDYRFLNQTDWIDPERSEIERTLGIVMDRRRTCLNSGVVYCKRESAGIWDPPAETMCTSHTAEQLFVEQSAFRLGYAELDSKWNWQFYFRDFWKHAPDAWVVHLATSNDKINNAKKMLKIWGEQP